MNKFYNLDSVFNNHIESSSLTFSSILSFSRYCLVFIATCYLLANITSLGSISL